MKFTRKKSIFLTGIFCGLILSSFLLYRLYSFQKKALAAIPDSVIGWNWNNTTGWISDNCLNDYNDDGVLENHCVGAGYFIYGINIDKITGGVYGEAWSPSVGWIKFDPSGPYPVTIPPSPTNNADDSALYNPATRELSGWAKLVNLDFGGDAWIKLQGPIKSAPVTGYTLCRGCAGVNPSKTCDVCYEFDNSANECTSQVEIVGCGRIGTGCASCSTSGGVPPITSCPACSNTYQYGVVSLEYDLGVNGIKNVLEGWAYNGGTDNKNIGWIHFDYAYANSNAPLAFNNFSISLAPANACKGADLFWESSSWANKYEIKRTGSYNVSQTCSAILDSNYISLDIIDSVSYCNVGNCSYNDPTLTENKYYCYKVIAWNDSGFTENSDGPKQIKTPLCAPSGFTSIGKTCGEINLSWQEKSGATGYEIYRGLKSDACNTLDPVNGVYPASCPKVTLAIDCGFAACDAVGKCCAKDENIIPRQNYYYNLTALSGTDKSPVTETFSQTLCYKGAEWQEE